MADTEALIDELAGLALFADLPRPELVAVAHTLEEEWYAEGQRILREGFSGTGFYVVLEGEVAVRIANEERARLHRGAYFGEGAILLGEPPGADVVAVGRVRVVNLAGPAFREFLMRHPDFMYRMLQEQTRRLRSANRWSR
ncbi:MAG: cyclic nucleotide-binding domain-containing protein [Candidatus Limnocylindrales bacterium]